MNKQNRLTGNIHRATPRLKHVLSGLFSGGTPDTNNDEYWAAAGEGIAWVAIGDMSTKDRVEVTEKRITESGIASKRLCVLPPGTLIYSMYASMGHVAELAIPATINQALLGLEFADGVEWGFAKWWLRHLQPLLIAEASSNTQDNLNADKVRNLPFPKIEFRHQSRIANYLDQETSRIDGLISEKERMLALLEEKRAALISRVVTRGLDHNAPLKPSGHEWLGEIPAHWGLQRLKQLAEVRGGLTLGKRYSAELLEYPYLRVANVQDGYLNLDDVSTVEVPASEAASNLLADGDVLMNEGGDIDKLGRGCVWRDEITPCLHQNHVFAVRPHSVDSEWLALWTSTQEAKRYFESRAKRSTNLASISGSNIKELPIPLPPLDEQVAIQHFLAVRTSRLEMLCDQLRGSLRLLTERRAALITAAVTGQIPKEELF